MRDRAGSLCGSASAREGQIAANFGGFGHHRLAGAQTSQRLASAPRTTLRTMLTPDDLNSLRGATIINADLREDTGPQRLRLLMEGGSERYILAISAEHDELHMADESG